MARRISLPRAGRLTPTGPVDAVASYHVLGMGWVLRRRLRWVRDAVLKGRVSSVLEIGYGSGIFMYELSEHADQVVGIDVHDDAGGVRDRLAADGRHPQLTKGSGMELPFRDHAFDVVVIVSALEFMHDPAACLREALRVVRSGGRVVCITPRVLPWADRLYRMLAGFDPETEFQGGRSRVQRALADDTLDAQRMPKPAGLPRGLAPYELVILRPPPGAPSTG